jgi:hypothetical protein
MRIRVGASSSNLLWIHWYLHATWYLLLCAGNVLDKCRSALSFPHHRPPTPCALGAASRVPGGRQGRSRATRPPPRMSSRPATASHHCASEPRLRASEGRRKDSAPTLPRALPRPMCATSSEPQQFAATFFVTECVCNGTRSPVCEYETTQQSND